MCIPHRALALNPSTVAVTRLRHALGEKSCLCVWNDVFGSLGSLGNMICAIFFSFITNRFNFAQKFICSTSVNCIWFVILWWAAVRENDILWYSVLFRVKHNAILTKLTVLLKKSCNFNSLWVITASEFHLGFFLWRRLAINFKQKFTFVCHWGVYFFHNLQTADWLQMRNSDAGNRYWFPDKLIYLSLGKDKLCCKKTKKTKRF